MSDQKERNLTTLWLALAHKIIASILVDHGAALPALEVLAHDSKLFPPKEGQIWRAICQAVEANTPPTLEAVGTRLNGTIEPGYLQTIAAGFNDDDNRRVFYHAQELKRVGLVAQARAIGRELSAITDPDQLAAAIAETEAALSGLLALQSERQPDAATVSAAAWDEVNSFEGDGIQTGLKWFDLLTGGIWPGFNYWVTAPYKAGKSTLMRNIILNIARAGNPVGAMCAEGTREMFALDCQAMLASDLLISEGFTINQLRIRGLFIKRAWRKQNLLKKEELDAIHEARTIWERLPIQVWDTRDGIKDHATFRHKIKRAKLDYGTRVFFGDHSQIFGAGDIYDRQSSTAHLVQDIATGEGVAVWMLSQQNEEKIKYGKEDSHSTGQKGGGDASAAADFELLPTIDEAAHLLKVRLHHSRHTATGSGEHHISPASGLIIDRYVQTAPTNSPAFWGDK